MDKNTLPGVSSRETRRKTNMTIDAETIQQFLAALTALILIIIAWYNKQRTDAAKSTAALTAANTAATEANTAATVALSTLATEPKPGFTLVRDGSAIAQGKDGYYARINPSPQAASLPDDKCWQAISPKGSINSGDRETVLYLITSDEAKGWRERNA